MHRDVKPANVLLTVGDEEHAYLTDFGLTKRTTGASGLTRTGDFVGTLDYVAPEQILGQAWTRAPTSSRSAALLHFALVGHAPFGARTKRRRCSPTSTPPRPC